MTSPSAVFENREENGTRIAETEVVRFVCDFGLNTYRLGCGLLKNNLCLWSRQGNNLESNASIVHQHINTAVLLLQIVA